MPSVYFTNKSTRTGIQKLLEKSNILDFICDGDLVAIKLHVGEDGNKYYLNPKFAKILVDEIRKKGANPFLTDTSSYYREKRHNAIDHTILARKHGFVFAPFIQSDGLGFERGIAVNTKGILKKIYVASLYSQVDKLLVLTHCTGHILAGFGGAIKNIGMGCATKKGKMLQHRLVNLELDEEKCDGCKLCTKFCPYGAPVVKNGKRRLDLDKKTCMRCPKCELECPQGAIKLKDKENLSEALASFVYGFMNFFGKENIRYVSVAKNITARCDCVKKTKIVAEDIGVFASDDIVAIECAFLDKLKFDFKKLHKVDPLIQIREAEELGLGSQKYELIEI